jgi:3-ketosteroid 9alpha-monooxygenase subunit A
VALGGRRLVAVQSHGNVGVHDADCPHRGAHLGFGGHLEKGATAVICPFHNYRIGLCEAAHSEFRVAQHDSLTVGDIVFARLSSSADCGFSSMIRHLSKTHSIIPGYTLAVRAPACLVIENGFDQAHFRPVHGVNGKAFETQTDSEGALVLTGHLYIEIDLSSKGKSRLSSGTKREVEMPFVLRSFSPGLSLLKVNGECPYAMIVGATPDEPRTSIIRIALALPKDVYGEVPPADLVSHLLDRSKKGIECDKAIWERLSLSTTNNLTAADAPILAFREFCKSFERA